MKRKEPIQATVKVRLSNHLPPVPPQEKDFCNGYKKGAAEAQKSCRGSDASERDDDDPFDSDNTE